MINLLPLEIVYHILVQVSYSSYNKLYQVLPAHIVNEALFLKLKQEGRTQQSILELVSTNLHELVAPYQQQHTEISEPFYPSYLNSNDKRNNESFLPLYFRSMDIKHQIIWFTPDIKSMKYYFEVKDFYVSHGKLVLRSKQKGNNTITSATSHKTINKMTNQQKVIGSLWDIRNKFPSTHSGNFSGTSSLSATNSMGTSIVNTTINVPSTTYQDHSYQHSQNINTDKKENGQLKKDSSSIAIILDACCISGLENSKQEEKSKDTHLSSYPPRPPSLSLNDDHYLHLSKNYSQQRQIFSPWHTTFTCGYFAIEHVGIDISEFLRFF
ncbi:unnamed protein product [Cunninghamella blakesleeana]